MTCTGDNEHDSTLEEGDDVTVGMEVEIDDDTTINGDKVTIKVSDVSVIMGNFRMV